MPDLISDSAEKGNDDSSLINTPEKIRVEDETSDTRSEKQNGEDLTITRIESPEEASTSGTSKNQHLEDTSAPEAMQQDTEETRKTTEEQKIDEERTKKGLKLPEEVKKKEEQDLLNKLAMEEALDLEQDIAKDLIPAIICPLTGTQYFIDP